MNKLIKVLMYVTLVVTVYTLGLAYFTMLREYSGASNYKQLQLDYAVLNSEYNSCVDYIRSKELSGEW